MFGTIHCQPLAEEPCILIREYSGTLLATVSSRPAPVLGLDLALQPACWNMLAGLQATDRSHPASQLHAYCPLDDDVSSPI